MISNILFEYLLDQFPLGLYILDNQGRYIYTNDAYDRLLDLPREKLIMRSVHELMHDGHYDACISDIVFREKQPVSVFLNVFVDDGNTIKRVRHLVRAVPLFEPAGEISYMIGICEAVNDLNECYHEAIARTMVAQSTTFHQPLTQEHRHSTQMIAVSEVMQAVLATAKNMAQVDSTVLISGASGTGKELMAEYIHHNSPRSTSRMVVVNCASIPENLLESTLYGYERGAFTGALASGKIGLIEAANTGTLFLDEINSLPLGLQGKLLRTLETKKVQRVGAVNEFSVDFRLIAATNQNLQEMVRTGLFREDLYYRLNILPIDLPSLRERREDIIPLARHYCNLFCSKYKKDIFFDDDALQRLVEYDWPGNIRELRNVIERIVVMSSQTCIFEDIVTHNLGAAPDPSPLFIERKPVPDNALIYSTMLDNHVSLQDYTERCEKAYLQYVLEKFPSTYETTKALQTTQSLVMRRKKKYNL